MSNRCSVRAVNADKYFLPAKADPGCCDHQALNGAWLWIDLVVKLSMDAPSALHKPVEPNLMALPF